MGAIVGVVIGYMLGTRAGERGGSELRASWHEIRTSEEMRDMVAGGISIAGSVVQRGSQMLVDRLQSSGDRSALRRVA